MHLHARLMMIWVGENPHFAFFQAKEVAQGRVPECDWGAVVSRTLDDRIQWDEVPNHVNRLSVQEVCDRCNGKCYAKAMVLVMLRKWGGCSDDC